MYIVGTILHQLTKLSIFLHDINLSPSHQVEVDYHLSYGFIKHASRDYTSKPVSLTLFTNIRPSAAPISFSKIFHRKEKLESVPLSSPRYCSLLFSSSKVRNHVPKSTKKDGAMGSEMENL